LNHDDKQSESYHVALAYSGSETCDSSRGRRGAPRSCSSLLVWKFSPVVLIYNKPQGKHRFSSGIKSSACSCKIRCSGGTRPARAWPRKPRDGAARPGRASTAPGQRATAPGQRRRAGPRPRQDGAAGLCLDSPGTEPKRLAVYRAEPAGCRRSSCPCGGGRDINTRYQRPAFALITIAGQMNPQPM
jgi:hypothetical protein